MKNYRLDETLLPKIWLTWTTVIEGKAIRMFMDNKGAKKTTPEPWMQCDSNGYALRYPRYDNDKRIPLGISWYTRDSDKQWVNSGSSLYYAYTKYHKDIDRLEIAVVKYDTTRKEVKHNWEYAGDRFFIGKDKSIINQHGAPCIGQFEVRRHVTVHRPVDMIRRIIRLNTSPMFINEFKKFIGQGCFIIGNGTPVSIKCGYHLEKWYMSKTKTRTKNRAQKIVDECVKYPLSSADDLSQKYLQNTFKDVYDRAINNIIYFERVNDELSVLRALVRDDNGDLEDAWRVYINDDGTNVITSKAGNEWVPSSQPSKYMINRDYKFVNKDEAIQSCNRIKYIAPLMSDNGNIYELMSAMRFPIIEQLYKMGYESFALQIARSSTQKAEIKNIFGGYYNEKESNALRQLGMTKHQLDKYYDKYNIGTDRYVRYGNESLALMRKIFGDELNHIDNYTFDRYLDVLKNILNDFYGRHYLDTIIDDDRQFWKNVVRLYSQNPHSARLLSDTLSTYRCLNTPRPEIDWMFDSYSDLVRAHDAIVALNNQQQEERRAYWNMSDKQKREYDEKKREKTDEERKHYEYEDDEFIIRLPKNVQEIINEGMVQRICIGGYASRHSEGGTNLFFLRKKDDEDTPFYAIEMSNEKTIVQIHGFGNRWLGNNPEAIPTVVRWLRKHDIKCDQAILTCKATGYGRRNDYVEMPQVD